MQSNSMAQYYDRIGKSCEQDEQHNDDTVNKMSNAVTPLGNEIASIEAWGLDCQAKTGSQTVIPCHCGKQLKLLDGQSARYVDSDDENFSDDKENVSSHNSQKRKRSKENDKRQSLSLPTTWNSTLKIDEMRSHSFPLMGHGSNFSSQPDKCLADCSNKDKIKAKRNERIMKKVFSPATTDFYSWLCKSEAFFGWQEDTEDSNEEQNAQRSDPCVQEDFSYEKLTPRPNEFEDNVDSDDTIMFADIESSFVDISPIDSTAAFHDIEITLFDDLTNPFDENIDF